MTYILCHSTKSSIHSSVLVILQTKLSRAFRFHQVAYKKRVREYIAITECIELQEEKLLRI